jgi:hypothetical protein
MAVPLIVPHYAIGAGFRMRCAIWAFTGEPSVVSGTICRENGAWVNAHRVLGLRREPRSTRSRAEACCSTPGVAGFTRSTRPQD